MKDFNDYFMLCLIAFSVLAVYLIALILVHYRRYVLTQTKIDALEFDIRGKIKMLQTELNDNLTKEENTKVKLETQIKMLNQGIILTNEAMVNAHNEFNDIIDEVNDKIDYAEDMLMDEIHNKIESVEERLDFAEVSISNINLKSFIKKNEERLSLLENSYAKFNQDLENLLKQKKSKPTDSFTSPVVDIIQEKKNKDKKIKKHIKTIPTKSMVIKRMEEKFKGVGVVALALSDEMRYKKEYKKAYAHLYYILNKK